jgi:hypothetical protein
LKINAMFVQFIIKELALDHSLLKVSLRRQWINKEAMDSFI